MADINKYAPSSGRFIGEDGKTYNLVDLLGGGGASVGEIMRDINKYAPKSGRVIGEDGKIYNLVDLLKNFAGGGGGPLLDGSVTEAKLADDVKEKFENLDSQLAQKATRNDLDLKVSQIVSGSPKGVFDTLTDLINEYPNGANGVYLVTEDGKWYYWNGSAWTAGGVYQGTGVAEAHQEELLRKLNIGSIKNLIKNGNFSNDSNVDGLADDWTKGGNVQQVRTENRTQYWTSSTSMVASSGIRTLGNYLPNKQGHKYYVSFKHSGVGGFYYMGSTHSLPFYPQSDGWFSVIIVPTMMDNSYNELRFYARAADVENSLNDVIFIDLTETFGAGNEPTLEEMDNFVKNKPYFETATTFNGSELVGKVSEIEKKVRNPVYINEYKESSNFQNAAHGRTRIVNYKTEKDEVINLLKLNAHSITELYVLTFKNEGENVFTQKSSTSIKINKTGEQVIPVNINVPKNHYVGFYSDPGIIKLTTDEKTTNFTFVGITEPEVPVEFIRQTDAKMGVSFAFENISTRISVLSMEVDSLKESGGFKEELPPGSSPFPSKPVIQHGKRPLYIEGPYGWNQPFHPDVIFFENGWNGWKYWMAYSPYPVVSDVYKERYENPCILVSNDGITWKVPDGLINPIDELTQENINNRDYMSDPELVYNETTNALECWYRITYAQENNNTLILRKTTTDGINWTNREVMIDSWSTEKVRSQAIIREDGKYKMWFTGDRKPIGYGESADGVNWIYSNCTFDQGKSPWHIDVGWDETKNNYYLINYLDNNVINYYTSDDGLSWTFIKDILTLEDGTFWDRRLYKSCAVYNGKEWMLYFTAEQEYSLVAVLGLMKGSSLDNLEVADGGYNINRSVFRQGIRLDNTVKHESNIILADTGECLGFDYETKSLYFQRADGTRVVIAK